MHILSLLLFLDPDKAYEACARRAAKYGLTIEQMAEVDESMLRFYEAEVHLADASFLAMALLNPAFLPLAAQAVLLSAWLAGTRKPLADLGDAVEESQSDAEYYPRALALTVGCATVCGVALLLAGSIIATALTVVYG